METKDLVKLVEKNILAQSIVEDSKVKSGDVSSHKLKIAANKAYKKEIMQANFGFNQLQNYCRNINSKELKDLTDGNGKKTTQKDFIEDMAYIKKVATWVKLKQLELANNEILFSHITEYGKEKELNNKQGEKTTVSLNFFFTVLERYKKDVTAQKSEEEKVSEEITKTENNATEETVKIQETENKAAPEKEEEKEAA